MRRAFFMLLTLSLLLGCTGVPATATVASRAALSPSPPKPSPTPRAAPSATASPTQPPATAAVVWPTRPYTITPVASLVWFTPTATPLAQPVGEIPYSAVQILRPGQEARVTSPFTFQALIYRNIAPAILHLELWAAGNGEPLLLYREVMRLAEADDPKASFLLNRKIPFEIRPAHAWARLQVVVRELNGLPQMQQSVFVQLLKYGLPEPSPKPQLLQPIVIESPEDEAFLPLKGTLVIEGYALVTSGQVEMLLYNPQGRILYAFSAPLSSPDPLGYGRFRLEWPYRFTRRQDLRLVVQTYDMRVPGVAYLESVDLFFR